MSNVSSVLAPITTHHSFTELKQLRKIKLIDGIEMTGKVK